MHLYQMKVSDQQFVDYTVRLWKAFDKVTTKEQLLKYKLSVRHVWAQATTEERIYRAEKIAAEYKFLAWKFAKALKEQA